MAPTRMKNDCDARPRLIEMHLRTATNETLVPACVEIGDIDRHHLQSKRIRELRK